MRIGCDGRKFPQAAELGPDGVIQRVHELGFDGVFFRSVLDISPRLDHGRLREIRARADELGLYLEMGLGKVNPFNTPEAPEVRAIGDGDYLRGMGLMIRACCAAGCTELWADTANYQRLEWGRHAIDRFRTDVTWAEQLAATTGFLRRLAPTLRELGCRVDLETHEEITTHELLRLIEAVGADALGVTLDLANVVVRGEDPVAATRRVAAHVRLTHIRDLVLTFTDEGLERQIRPCGEGVIDWRQVLGALAAQGHAINLSIENVGGRDRNRIQIFDPEWQTGHPDLSLSEVLTLVRHARTTEERMRAGEIAGRDDYYPGSLDADGQVDWIRRCTGHLREVLAAMEVA